MGPPRLFSFSYGPHPSQGFQGGSDAGRTRTQGLGLLAQCSWPCPLPCGERRGVPVLGAQLWRVQGLMGRGMDSGQEAQASLLHRPRAGLLSLSDYMGTCHRASGRSRHVPYVITYSPQHLVGCAVSPMRKPRLREAEKLVPGSTAGRGLTELEFKLSSA